MAIVKTSPAPLLLSLAYLVACAHGEVSAPQQLGAPPAPAKAGHELPASPVPTGRIEDYMLDHYAIVTLSRDAVIAGTVEGLRRPLRAFASHDYADVEGSSWFPWILTLQEQARLTASSGTLDLAAAGVAAMARTCGECHRSAGTELTEGEVEFVYDDEWVPAAERRMMRHRWAATLLWEGLIAPSEAAWRAGASALAQVSEKPLVAQPPWPESFVLGLVEVRELGERAKQATTLAERANVYGELLATCASCHAQQVDHRF